MIIKNKNAFLEGIKKVGFLFFASLTLGMNAYAYDLTKLKAEQSSFAEILKFIGQWTTYLGAAIAFFGAVQIASGFRSEDAHAKEKGVRAMIGGFIVIAIALSTDAFLKIGG